MSATESRDPAAPDPNQQDAEQRAPRGGSGAASALERVKADHALRRQHGPRSAGPGHEDDRTPER